MKVSISGRLEYRFADVDVDVPDDTPVSSMARHIEETIDFGELRQQSEPELDIYDIQTPEDLERAEHE